MNAFASLYAQDAATPENANLVARKVTGWTSAGTYFGALVPVVASDAIRITVAGTFLVLVQLAFSGSANTEMHFHLAVNDVIKAPGTHRKLSGGDVGSCSFILPWFFSPGDLASVYVDSDNPAGTMTLVDGQFVITG
jgi:hypothetical protein